MSFPKLSHQQYLPITSTHTPCSQWRALTQRTSSIDLPFYYGVLSTRVYCRPTCTARLARRANITAACALSAGYRPCKRCRPNDELFFGEGEEIAMKVIGIVGEGRGKIGLDKMAAEIGITKSYLCRVFKKTMGMTIGEYSKEFEKRGQADNGSLQYPVNLDLGGQPWTPDLAKNSSVPHTGEHKDVSTVIIDRSLALDLETEHDFDHWLGPRPCNYDNFRH
ncbi:hypothetical protein E4T47_04105 [Aureobasidium subglaciale]|nr:hypothetical protein E4T47_04105 [Aureobasidium subglaciale]